MKPLFSILVVAGLLSGCRRDHPRNWLIESYEDGRITLKHDGNTYKAKCDGGMSFTPFESFVQNSTCEMAIGLVGHEIQPFEGKQRNADGRIVVMWNVGDDLALKSVKDDRTPWRQEHFIITSVTKN